MKDDPFPITATVAQFAKLSGLGKTSIYELINVGQLRSALVCGRRLIVVASWLEMIGRQTVLDRTRSSLTDE